MILRKKVKINPDFAKKKSIYVKSKSSSYYAVYTTTKHKLYINELAQLKKRSNTTELIEIYNTLFKKAQEKNIKQITANTWIFYQHPKLAEKLGFKMVKGTDAYIKEILKKYPNHKIIDASHDLHGIRYLTLMHKDTKKIKKLTFLKFELPSFVKEM